MVRRVQGPWEGRESKWHIWPKLGRPPIFDRNTNGCIYLRPEFGEKQYVFNNYILQIDVDDDDVDDDSDDGGGDDVDDDGGDGDGGGGGRGSDDDCGSDDGGGDDGDNDDETFLHSVANKL